MSKSNASLIPSTDALLHRPSKLVDDSMFEDNSAQLVPIASLLLNSMVEYNGIGISACQIGIDLNMFAIHTDGQVRVCINSEIYGAVIGEMVKDSEGCLSYPGLELKVKRPSSIVARYKNLEGKEVTEKLEGLTARAWLHEFDHTQGICFVNRVSKLSLDMAKKKLNKLEKRKIK